MTCFKTELLDTTSTRMIMIGLFHARFAVSVLSGSSQAVKYLLSLGADPNMEGLCAMDW